MLGTILFATWIGAVVASRALSPDRPDRPIRAERIVRSPDDSLEAVISPRSSLAGSLRVVALYVQPAGRPNLRVLLGTVTSDPGESSVERSDIAWPGPQTLVLRLPRTVPDWPKSVRVNGQTVELRIQIRPES